MLSSLTKVNSILTSFPGYNDPIERDSKSGYFDYFIRKPVFPAETASKYASSPFSFATISATISF